jgi:hypothetical protein
MHDNKENPVRSEVQFFRGSEQMPSSKQISPRDQDRGRIFFLGIKCCEDRGLDACFLPRATSHGVPGTNQDRATAPLLPLEIQYSRNCYIHTERPTKRPQDLGLPHTEDVHKYDYVDVRLHQLVYDYFDYSSRLVN